MKDAQASEKALGTPPEVRLAEAWADFTKALAIYPESNNRVRLNLERLREALHKATAGGSGLTLIFRDSQLVVGADQFECAGSPSLLWLRRRLDRAGLAGVEFRSDVGDSALVDFSQKLLTNFLQKDKQQPFDAMWPEPFDGLTLLDRRFVGSFGGGGSGTALAGRGRPARAGTGDETYVSPQEKHTEPAQDGHYRPADGLPLKNSAFLAGLMAETEIAGRLEHLHNLIDAKPAEEDTPSQYRASDLLQQIIEDLSVDSVKDRPTLVRSLCTAFDKILSPDETRPEGEQEEFAALLKGVSESHFSREGADMERLQPKEGDGPAAPSDVGRKRDDAIDDDVESLIQEYERLPARLEVKLDQGGAESEGEVLTVLLHYLVHLENPEGLRGLYPALGELLERPTPEALAILKRYLKEATGDDAESVRSSTALIGLLVRIGQSWILRLCGLLGPEEVATSFPQHFGAYLATLDTAKPEDLVELNQVCQRIGHDRMLEAGTALHAELERLDDSKVVALLARPAMERLSLTRLLIDVRRDLTTEQGAQFLRALDLPDPGAFLLYEMPDPRHLTVEYLVNLIDHHLGRVSTGRLSESVADVLCRHIRDTHMGDRKSPDRLASIRNLLRFPAPEGWKMLKQLSKTRWGVFGADEPMTVRRLAKSISKLYRTA